MKKIFCPICKTKFTEELLYGIKIYDDYKLIPYKCLNNKCGANFEIRKEKRIF